jgi:signal transduction histidine kinase
MKKANILVVDDEESIRFVLNTILSNEGYSVRTSQDLVKAREMISENEFDIAIVDRILRDGEDGIDLLEELQTAQPLCQAILISAYPSYESAARAMNGNAAAYLSKPLEKAIILETVRRTSARARMMRQQLIQKNRMETVAALAGGMVHDFGNILQIIMTNLELFLSDKNLPAFNTDKLTRALDAALRGEAMIRRTLGIGRCKEQENDKKITINVNHEIGRMEPILRDMLSPKNIELKISLTHGLKPVAMDLGHLEQILLNLCINARDAFSKEKNRHVTGSELKTKKKLIKIETTSLQADELCRDYPEFNPVSTDYVRIQVSDTGCGIPREIRPRVFEPFFTTKKKQNGSGMGLFMSQTLIKRYEGDIFISSGEQGSGTTFTILLPEWKEERLFSDKEVNIQEIESIKQAV